MLRTITSISASRNRKDPKTIYIYSTHLETKNELHTHIQELFKIPLQDLSARWTLLEDFCKKEPLRSLLRIWIEPRNWSKTFFQHNVKTSMLNWYSLKYEQQLKHFHIVTLKSIVSLILFISTDISELPLKVFIIAMYG